MAAPAIQPQAQRPTSSEKSKSQVTIAALDTINQARNNNTSDRQYSGRNSILSPPSVAISPQQATLESTHSFLSRGRMKNDAVADAAASLSWVSQKPSEQRKLGPSASASMAAMLAKNPKPSPPWQPEVLNTNYTMAAVIAARSGGKNEAWKQEASVWGNSAANQAFKSSERSGNPNPQAGSRNVTGISRHGSMVAATGAMTGHRERSDSSPLPRLMYPDEVNAAQNALSAATHANKPTTKLKTEPAEPGVTPSIKMSREMFTSHPPVALEMDEKHKSDILRASALAMAKQMYSVQQKKIDKPLKAYGNDIKSAASSAHRRLPSGSAADSEITPKRFNSIQEAAQKLAQERLAKLHDENLRNRQYRDYYGGSQRYKSRLSIGRRRARSEGSVNDDKVQLEEIRIQMRLFSSSLSKVDARKREVDREALMVIAQRNVAASLRGMDQKILDDKGKVTPSILNEWEVKAHTAAQRNSESRMENYGKIDIGGGKYIDQSLVDQIAARNVLPVLEEISVRAEQDRVRKAESKLEQEAKKRAVEAKKVREKEIKEVNKILKDQDKGVEKAQKEVKPIKTDQTSLENVNMRKTKEVTTALGAVIAEPTVGPMDTELELVVKGQETPNVKAVSPELANSIGCVVPSDLRTSMEMQAQQRLSEVAAGADESPASPEFKGVKGWLKTRLGRHMTKGQKSEVRGNNITNAEAFVGGATLTGVTSGNKASNASLEDVREPEPARENQKETGVEVWKDGSGSSKCHSSSVGSPSISDTEDGLTREELEIHETADHLDEGLRPPSVIPTIKSWGPARDSRFHEEM